MKRSINNRIYWLAAVLLFLSTSAISQSHYGVGDVVEFRGGRDKEFRNRFESPLLDLDFQQFTGLSYFEVDEQYKIHAVFDSTLEETYFLMPTSTGISARYKKIGVLKFVLNGKEFSLNAYQSERILTNEVWNKKFGDSLFIPFKDETNGDTTYGGGRYIYMKIPSGAETVLDFNLAFNPSCAYGSTKYNCPIPPRANRLSAEIKAGEKSFSYTRETK